MKAPHVLWVRGGEPDRFAGLLAALSAAGLRAGWLDLLPPPPAAEPLPAHLAAATDLGARRAVSAGGGRSLALKPLRGEPVLRDLLREHFLGCSLVLLRAAAASSPVLEPAGDGWRITPTDAAAQHYDTPALLARLRRPHPWGPAPGRLDAPD